MDLLLLFKAVIMGIVEGVTEFLPISSTGHLIITAELIDFWTAEKRSVFEVAIQLGAILAVCWEYRQRLWKVASGLGHDPAARRFVTNVAIAFVPAAVLGFLFLKTIKLYLFHPLPVAMALVAGGVLILWAEKRDHRVTVQEVDDMTWKDALKVGCAQCLALVPGTSRSGATIIGGLLFGLSRKAATEFSFFLAIPTMFAATGYDLFKHRHDLAVSDFPVFLVGFVTAFVSALLVVRGLMRFIAKHDFSVFAYYRILFGGFILVTAYSGLLVWSS